MRKRFFHLLSAVGLTVLLTAMFSGCTEELATEMTKNRIMLTADDSGFDNEHSVTRGSKVTSISSFGVSASVYNAASTYTTAGCGSYFYKEAVTNGTPMSYYWPTSDYRLSFFSYYPRDNAAFTVQSSAATAGAPTYHYTVPSAIASQVDVMTGQNVDVLGGGTSAVGITMKHRCAAVSFSVTNSRSSAITLSSVSIEGVKYDGTLCEDTWTLSSAVNSSSANPFSLSYGSSIAASATANITGTSNIFLMLPQAIPATAKVKLVVDGEDPMEAELSGVWEAGKQYTYSMTVTQKSLIIDPLTEVTDWTGEVKYFTVSGVSTNGIFTQPSVNNGQGMGIEDWTEEE